MPLLAAPAAPAAPKAGVATPQKTGWGISLLALYVYGRKNTYQYQYAVRLTVKEIMVAGTAYTDIMGGQWRNGCHHNNFGNSGRPKYWT